MDYKEIDYEISVLENRISELKKKKEKRKLLEKDFYMITLSGDFGTKVRHEDYKKAVKEAKRLSKKMNHPAYLMKVVEIIDGDNIIKK